MYVSIDIFTIIVKRWWRWELITIVFIIKKKGLIHMLETLFQDPHD
jgi:hypothetical protein